MVRYRELFDIFHEKFTTNGSITVDDTGLINVAGNLRVRRDAIVNNLPIKFGKVFGDVEFGYRDVNSLIGCPKEVIGNFDCSHSYLRSLEGAPIKVAGNFICNNNILQTLEYGPHSVDGHYSCYSNKLESLIGLAVGMRGRVDVNKNPLKSLEGLDPTYTGHLRIEWQPHLPLLRILRCSEIEIDNNKHVRNILQKYNGDNFSRSNILKCQKELIDAGFEGNASW